MIFFIIGYMGAGKSSVGREAARRTGLKYVDMDRLIEEEYGKTITEIFDTQGETEFRKSERRTLEQLIGQGGDLIVSCGGGTPCQSDNMSLMNRAGKTIYLKLSPSKLTSRLRPGQVRRPILKGMDSAQILEMIGKMLPAREPYYLKASMVVDCDALSDDSIFRHVADYIAYYSAADDKLKGK